MKHACLQRYFVIRRNNVNHALLPNNEKRLASQSQRGDRAFWQARRGVRNQSHLVALGVSFHCAWSEISFPGPIISLPPHWLRRPQRGKRNAKYVGQCAAEGERFRRQWR